MKTIILNLIVLAGTGLVLTGCGGHHESKRSTQVEAPARTASVMPAYSQWEYKTLRLAASANDFDKQLNDAGAQGWKLISVTQEADGYAFYTFERSRQQQQ